MAQTVGPPRHTSRTRGRLMRASTTDSWTSRWSRAARSPWTRRFSTVALLFAVVGLAAVHLSTGATPEQQSVSPVDGLDAVHLSTGATPQQESVSPVDPCARP